MNNQSNQSTVVTNHNHLDSLASIDPRTADQNLLCVPRRVLVCGDVVMHENKGQKGTWHVPGGSTMTTKEVEGWAKRMGISGVVKAEIRNFFYRKE